jgi:hypothetical protein
VLSPKELALTNGAQSANGSGTSLTKGDPSELPKDNGSQS